MKNHQIKKIATSLKKIRVAKLSENCYQVSIHSIRTRHQILIMYHTIVEHHRKKICHRSGIAKNPFILT